MNRVTDNVPRPAPFADVAAYMAGVGAAARAAARDARARRHRDQERRAARRWRPRSAATQATLLAANAEDVAGARAPGTTPRSSTG